MQYLQYFCKNQALSGYLYFQGRYEVRDLFPWENVTKIATSYLLNVEKKKLKIGSNKRNIDFKLLPNAIISAEKSTSEIDADLAQNEK